MFVCLFSFYFKTNIFSCMSDVFCSFRLQDVTTQLNLMISLEKHLREEIAARDEEILVGSFDVY